MGGIVSNWKQYYNKAKAREKNRLYYYSHPDKIKERNERYKSNHYDKWLESRRKGYAKWIANPENQAKKKAYQREWYQKVKKKSEKEQRHEIYKVRDLLRKQPYIVDDYSAEMKKDTGGMFFFFIKKKGKVVYVSNKYSNENKAVKNLLEAI